MLNSVTRQLYQVTLQDAQALINEVTADSRASRHKPFQTLPHLGRQLIVVGRSHDNNQLVVVSSGEPRNAVRDFVRVEVGDRRAERLVRDQTHSRHRDVVRRVVSEENDAVVRHGSVDTTEPRLPVG